jgi:hypothetical protein
MTDLWILHPDPALRSSFAKTLQQAWGNDAIEAIDPAKALQAKAGTLCVWLGDIGDATPAQQSVCLELSFLPPRLGEIVWQLQQALFRLRWPKKVTIGKAYLDTSTRHFHTGDTEVELTEKEVALLVYVAQSENAVTRADLLRDVWRYAADTETHTIETHIHRLRQKIERDPENPVFLVTTKDGYVVADD